ncbi:MAG: aldo/keto reductase [Eubacteriales bacterium]
MQYRDFGKTGQKISALGFGCMRLPEYEKDGKWYINEDKAIPMLRTAYERGVNYFDTAVMYCHDNSQYTVGRAVKPFRDKVMVSTKLPLHEVKKTSDFRRMLEQSLTRLDMPYIDFYHFHGIDKGAYDGVIKPLGLIDEARKAIDEGLIKHMSYSFHGDPADIPYITENCEIISSVLLQYNLLDRGNEEGIKYLASKNIGVVVMGPVAGGRLAAPSLLAEKLTGEKDSSSYELAFKFVLGNKGVSCALSGMSTMEDLEKNLVVADLEEPMSEEDWQKSVEAMENIRRFSDLYCTGCNYCMPCTSGINIPHVFSCHTYNSVYGIKGHAKWMYGAIGREDWAGADVSSCVDCGACLDKCPQHIDIPNKLREVSEEFKA